MRKAKEPNGSKTDQHNPRFLRKPQHANERLQIIKQYANSLRKMLRKLRGKHH